MKNNNSLIYYFVDESGDPNFFNSKGDLIIGSDGCSPILIIGLIRTAKPSELRKSILELKKNIITDDYLQDIPSIQKTKLSFHAKNDCSEVREKVFKVIKSLDFKAEFIVARKNINIFTNRHKKNEDIFYSEIISRLFEKKLHKNDNIIYFSKRGNKIKQQHFEQAIQTSILNFEGKYSQKVETNTKIYIQIPSDEPCLQIIDYMNWALQRAFIRKEERYLNFVKEKISFICDIYDFNNYPNNFYNKRNVFDIKKISPL